jgi:hypothetical protein
MPANTTLWTTLIVLVVVGVALYLINAIRRTRREHRSRSEERAAAMMLALHQRQPAASAPGVPAATGVAPRAEPPAAPAPAPVSRLTRRPRFLTDSQRLLYLLLRSALPDHTIMGNVRLVDLIDGTVDNVAIEHNDRLRELLRERIDLVVCNTDLVPVAALMIYESGVPASAQESVKVEALRELGIKFLRFRTDNLPRAAEIRGLVIS